MINNKIDFEYLFTPEQRDILEDMRKKISGAGFGISLDEKTAGMTLRFTSGTAHVEVSFKIERIYNHDAGHTICDSCGEEFEPEDLEPIEVIHSHGDKKNPIKSKSTEYMCVDCYCPK